MRRRSSDRTRSSSAVASSLLSTPSSPFFYRRATRVPRWGGGYCSAFIGPPVELAPRISRQRRLRLVHRKEQVEGRAISEAAINRDVAADLLHQRVHLGHT